MSVVAPVAELVGPELRHSDWALGRLVQLVRAALANGHTGDTFDLETLDVHVRHYRIEFDAVVEEYVEGTAPDLVETIKEYLLSMKPLLAN